MLSVAYLGYFIFALYHHVVVECSHPVSVVPLIVVTCVALAGIVMHYIWKKFGRDITATTDKVRGVVMKKWRILKWSV